MIDTSYKLTNTEIEDILHNMSPSELWQLNDGVQPINIHFKSVNIEKSQKIYDIMDLTDLEYADVEGLLDNPYNATLSDIHTYCKAMNLDMLDFIKKAMV
jgi:hypothetical protein